MRRLSLREQIMALPEGERLEAALYMIDELTIGRPHEVTWMRETFGLTPAVALMLTALNRAYPRHMTHVQLLRALYGVNAEERDPKIVQVFVNHARARLGPRAILTVWGVGYQLRAPLPVPPEPEIVIRPPPEVIPPPELVGPRPNARTPWSFGEKRELVEMVVAGVDIGTMADRLGRTERAVLDAIRLLYTRAAQLHPGMDPKKRDTPR